MDRVTITEEELNALQWTTLEYYIREENYCNGLIADKTQAGSPASIAAVGMALATLPLAAERAYLPREHKTSFSPSKPSYASAPCPFDRGALEQYAADCWPVAQWDATPDAERWAREFIDAGLATVTA